jgi:hypothetical protein
MELVLRSAEINLPQEIANLEALKAELAPKLEQYNSLVVTEDSIKAAKADKAALNKLRTAIEDQRKAAKKQYLEPYNILEAQCKEVVALIDAPIGAIDKQLKVFDEKEKQWKYTELFNAFNELEPPEWVKFEDVINPKWGNKTEKVDSLVNEMKTALQKFNAEYEQLEKLYENFPHKLAIIDRFKDTKSFSETMVYAKKLEFEYDREKALKEQLLKAAEEEQAKQAESVQNEPEAAAPVNDVITPEPEQTAAPVESEQAPKIIIGRFEVAGTADQIKALGNFMKSNGIKFSIIKD